MLLVRKQTTDLVVINPKRERKSGLLLICIILCAVFLLCFYFAFYLHENKKGTHETSVQKSNNIYIQAQETNTTNSDNLNNDSNKQTQIHRKEFQQYNKDYTAQQIFNKKNSVNDTNLLDKNVSKEKIDAANNLLEFYNQSVLTLSSDWYVTPELIKKNLAIYTETWQLPKLPPHLYGRSSAKSNLLAGSYLPCFKGRSLNKIVNEMDTAIHSMLVDYRSLEKYNNDDTIIDDGRKGNDYIKSIQKSQKKYSTARLAWIEIVRPEVSAAEKLLLQNHPLQRHSMIARKIFDLFTATASALGQDKIDRKNIQNISKQLDACLEDANSLSFATGPQYERHYRSFLTAAKNFSDCLHEGISSGFYRTLREKLNHQIRTSRDAYNNFASGINLPLD